MKIYLKKIISFLLVFCMTFSMFSIPVKAESAKSDIKLENGKIYSVPLNLYNPDNSLVTDEKLSNNLESFVDNVAMVEKKNDDTYRITLKIENYNKIDMLQLLKQGSVDADTQPKDVPLSTYNIPERYICNPQHYREQNPDDTKYPEEQYPEDEATDYLKEKGYMNEQWNDKYIKDIHVKKADGGASYYSFDVGNLQEAIYVKCFRSYGRATSRSTYISGIQSGKIEFNYYNAEQIDTISAGNYEKVAGKISKVVTKTGANQYFNPGTTGEANNLLSDIVNSQISEGKVSATFTLKDNENEMSVQILEDIYDLGEFSGYPRDAGYREYSNAYGKECIEKSGKYTGISIYGDNVLEDDSFTVTYENIEEVVFGKKIKILANGETAYLGELRIRTTPKQELILEDGDITLVSDTYTLNEDSDFESNKIEENTDEGSEYSLLYSMLAGSAKRALLYKPSLTLQDKRVTSDENVELKIIIPDEWDMEMIEVHRLNGTYQEGMMNPIDLYGDGSSYSIEGNVLTISTAYVNNTFAIIEKSTKVNIGELTDGVYKVNVTMWQAENPARLSMSNAAVVSDSAQLIISENTAKKQIYFDMQGITIAGTFGYSNGLFFANNEREEEGTPILNTFQQLDYYGYYVNQSGSTDMDSYAEEYDLYYPKTVGFEMPESVDEDNGVYIRFWVPIMDELSNFTPGSGEGSRVAFMSLSGAQKVAEICAPKHDASVLTVAVDKASRYNSEDYSEKSYKNLADAVKAAQEALEEPLLLTDEKVVQLDNAITLSINELVEESAMTKYNKVLNKVENLIESDYTVESWADLQTVINSQSGKVTEENALEAAQELQEAIDSLKKATDIVDKNELNGYIADAETKENNNEFTEKSWGNFQAAILSAKAVSQNAQSTQDQVDKQIILLQAVYKALVTIDEEGTVFPGTYSVNATLWNATADEPSMGNAALNPTSTIRITEEGDVSMELAFQGMTFAGKKGYLYKLRKVDMDSIEYNEYYYPVKYTAEDAAVLENYTDVYDDFNDPNSQYYDSNTNGDWYPKLISIPIDLNDNLFYVEVYVPVMESISEGTGTKLARMNIDWTSMSQETGIEKDDSVLLQLLTQASKMSQGEVPDEVWQALVAAYDSAREIYEDINSTEGEVNNQVEALQAAIDAVELVTVDKSELNNLIIQAQELADREDVDYTEKTLQNLKNAIAEAKNVAEDEDATYAQVAAQINDLQAAINTLKTVDKTELEDMLTKAQKEAEKTDVYTSESISALKSVITMAQGIKDDPKADEGKVNAARDKLKKAIENLTKIHEVNKTQLLRKIEEAKEYLKKVDKYTGSSLDQLETVVDKACSVYDSTSASQDLVDEQIEKLNNTIAKLVEISDEHLDIRNLKDGVYSITGNMIKIDKKTPSMSNDAINHTIKLTVKDGKYFITMDFKGLKINDMLGYLGTLKYFKSGYTLNKYGAPQGELGESSVDAYQKNKDGSLISDNFGTDYPDLITFELIPEALEDGYVPLQVFVPIMESISPGTGEQPVFLKLDWSTLKKTTENDPGFEDDGRDKDNKDDKNKNGGLNKIGNNKLGANKLKTGNSLKLNNKKLNSPKTGDTSDVSVFIALALISFAMLVIVLKISKKRNIQ